MWSLETTQQVAPSAYAGEVALVVVLADLTGELTELHRVTEHHPPRLGQALIAGLWEASFLIENARKAVSRNDTTYVAGCLFRAVGMCVHALHGHTGRWLINEKGAVASADRLPAAPPTSPHALADPHAGGRAHLSAGVGDTLPATPSKECPR